MKRVSPIPVSPGKFDVDFELSQDEIPDWVVPGMTCKIAVKSYDKKDALAVPKAAIREDEDDPNKKYVGESPDQCAVIRFTCEEGQEYFADDCGCGCQATAA